MYCVTHIADGLCQRLVAAKQRLQEWLESMKYMSKFVYQCKNLRPNYLFFTFTATTMKTLVCRGCLIWSTNGNLMTRWLHFTVMIRRGEEVLIYNDNTLIFNWTYLHFSNFYRNELFFWCQTVKWTYLICRYLIWLW